MAAAVRVLGMPGVVPLLLGMWSTERAPQGRVRTARARSPLPPQTLHRQPNFSSQTNIHACLSTRHTTWPLFLSSSARAAAVFPPIGGAERRRALGCVRCVSKQREVGRGIDGASGRRRRRLCVSLFSHVRRSGRFPSARRSRGRAAAVVRRRFWPFWCGESHRGTQNGPLWTTSLDQPLVGQKEGMGDLDRRVRYRSRTATFAVRRTQSCVNPELNRTIPTRSRGVPLLSLESFF